MNSMLDKPRGKGRGFLQCAVAAAESAAGGSLKIHQSTNASLRLQSGKIPKAYDEV
jgi:hypothetical protein